jgi:trk system potassium uptake protein TrkA
VEDTDLFLALTDDDEDNIMSCLLAKRMGARRVLALINRRSYADLMQGTQIDIALSPAQAMLGELLAHVRQGDVQAVHSLRRGVAEALEPWRGRPQEFARGGPQGERAAPAARCAHRA